MAAARMNVLSDLLAAIFERTERAAKGRDTRSLEALCEALLAEGNGEAAGLKLAGSILDTYESLDADGRVGFFALLAERHDVDPQAVAGAARAYAAAPSGANYVALQRAAEPPRQEIMRRLNRLPGATGRLVRMRADLLRLKGDHPRFAAVDADAHHLFQSWFNRGFLVLRRIDWSTPAHLLEKIIEYEAVHAIGDWDELRRRLQPPDRRCFAFMHPAMPDDPLIFVEVALTDAVPASIEAVLSPEREAIAAARASTATFYSISNCQPGLAGISFGNSLIKQVAADIAAELPGVETFVTLSPVPGLARWLEARASDGDADDLAVLAAHYLVEEKRADARPLDPVARFHLGNGASLDAIHLDADRSAAGRAASRGVMVNYLYDLARVDARHEAYARTGAVHAARRVRALASRYTAPRPHEQTETHAEPAA